MYLLYVTSKINGCLNQHIKLVVWLRGHIFFYISDIKYKISLSLSIRSCMDTQSGSHPLGDHAGSHRQRVHLKWKSVGFYIFHVLTSIWMCNINSQCNHFWAGIKLSLKLTLLCWKHNSNTISKITSIKSACMLSSFFDLCKTKHIFRGWDTLCYLCFLISWNFIQ